MTGNVNIARNDVIADDELGGRLGVAPKGKAITNNFGDFIGRQGRIPTFRGYSVSFCTSPDQFLASDYTFLHQQTLGREEPFCVIAVPKIIGRRAILHRVAIFVLVPESVESNGPVHSEHATFPWTMEDRLADFDDQRPH